MDTLEKHTLSSQEKADSRFQNVTALELNLTPASVPHIKFFSENHLFDQSITNEILEGGYSLVLQ